MLKITRRRFIVYHNGIMIASVQLHRLTLGSFDAAQDIVWEFTNKEINIAIANKYSVDRDKSPKKIRNVDKLIHLNGIFIVECLTGIYRTHVLKKLLLWIHQNYSQYFICTE